MSVTRRAPSALPREPSRLVSKPGRAGELIQRSSSAWSAGANEPGAWGRLAEALERPTPHRATPRPRTRSLLFAIAATMGLAVLSYRVAVHPPWVQDSARAHTSHSLPEGVTVLDDGSTVEVLAGTVAWTEAKSADARVHLDHGRLDLHVTRRAPDSPPFTVFAGAYRFRVLGTRFRLSAASQGVDLEVHEGAVAVSHASGILATVTAGAHWHGAADPDLADAAAPPPSSGATPIDTAPESRERSSGQEEGPSPVADPGNFPRADLGDSPRAGSRSLPRAAAAVSDAGTTRAPSVVEPSQPTVPSLGVSSSSEALRRSDERSRQPQLNDDAPPGGQASRLIADPPTPELQGPSMTEEAEPARAMPDLRVAHVPDCLAHSRAGRSREALTCFQAIAQGNDLSAQMALYEIARLNRDVFGDRAAALSALSDYRSRFPQGALRGEVELSRIELLVETHRADLALAESEAMLSTRFGHERAADLHLLRGNLYREALHDCVRAEAEYDRIPASTSAAATEASYGRARCLEITGQRAAAARAYEEYAARPHAAHAADARARARALSR